MYYIIAGLITARASTVREGRHERACSLTTEIPDDGGVQLLRPLKSVLSREKSHQPGFFKVIHEAKLEDSVSFYDNDGSKIPW
jgi:hypothetical protein